MKRSERIELRRHAKKPLWHYVVIGGNGEVKSTSQKYRGECSKSHALRAARREAGKRGGCRVEVVG